VNPVLTLVLFVVTTNVVLPISFLYMMAQFGLLGFALVWLFIAVAAWVAVRVTGRG
jgi:hypothetical protein